MGWTEYLSCFFFLLFFLTEKSRTKPILKCGSPKNNSVLLGQNASMTCIVVISGTLPDFRWVKWNAIPSTYPNSLDFENGSYTLVNPVQYETVHVQGKYGVKVNIQNVTPKDLGLYTCYVSNHLGSDYRSAFLSERTKRWTGSDGKIAVKSNLYERSALVKNWSITVHFIHVMATVTLNIMKVRRWWHRRRC